MKIGCLGEKNKRHFLGRAGVFHGIIVATLGSMAYHWGTLMVFY
jgi:hypothetical protein